MRENVERELKLVPGEGFELPALGTELPPRAFVSSYFDTPDRRLARRGITFRHRLEDGTGLWQLKLPSDVSRIELEVPGHSDAFKVLGAAKESRFPAKRVAKSAADLAAALRRAAALAK